MRASDIHERPRPQARAGGNRREAAARARSEVGNITGAPPSEVKSEMRKGNNAAAAQLVNKS